MLVGILVPAPAARGQSADEVAAVFDAAIWDVISREGTVYDVRVRTRRIGPSAGPEPYPAVEVGVWPAPVIDALVERARLRRLMVSTCDTLCHARLDDERVFALSRPDSIGPGLVRAVLEQTDTGGRYDWELVVERAYGETWQIVARRFLAVRDWLTAP